MLIDDFIKEEKNNTLFDSVALSMVSKISPVNKVQDSSSFFAFPVLPVYTSIFTVRFSIK